MTIATRALLSCSDIFFYLLLRHNIDKDGEQLSKQKLKYQKLNGCSQSRLSLQWCFSQSVQESSEVKNCQNSGGNLSIRDSGRVEQGKNKDSKASGTVQGL